MKTQLTIAALVLIVMTLVAGCGGGGVDMPSAPPTTYTSGIHVAVNQFGTDYSTQSGSVTLIDEADIYFKLVGQMYETDGSMHTCGGFDPRSITWTFKLKDANGVYRLVGLTPAWTDSEGLARYQPPAGDYLVTGTFPFEGKTYTTPPLNILIVEGRGG